MSLPLALLCVCFLFIRGSRGWEISLIPGFRVRSSGVRVDLPSATPLASASLLSCALVLTYLFDFPYSDNVSAYCLHIAEDDGEVDTDFPPLDSNEPIHKFGFSTLALVEKYSSPGLTSKESLFVRM